MSQAKKDTQLQECYRVVSSISRQSSNAAATDVPLILLQLRQVLAAKTLSVKQTNKVKEYIWLNDLLHMNIEALRQDFTKVEGQWATAAELASILSSICGGLHPKESGHHGESYAEQLREFYDILLPTSADSLLILANNLLEMEQQRVDSGLQVSELVHFQSILDSLLEVCCSHKQCVERVLQSPYLLHILITDLIHHCSVLLLFLRDLVVIDPGLFSALPPDVLYSLLDELVFKLSGKQESAAILSLELMSTFALMNHSILELISSRYTGILELSEKWSGRIKVNTNVTNFISQLKAAVELESQDGAQHKAAAVVQAAWRGYASRKKLKKMQLGIRRFQRKYREWKAKKLKQEEESKALKTLNMAKQLNLKSQRLMFQEKQLQVVEQLPAAEIGRFVTQQENAAATVIQSWWRCRLACSKYNNLRNEAKRSQSATVIQRAFRTYKRRSSKKDCDSRHHHILRQIEGAQREALQGEITRYQECHAPTYTSQSQAKELHDKVQTLTEQFYLSRVEQQGRDRQRTELISQLNDSCEMLLRAPSLSDSYTISDTPEILSVAGSSSTAVAKMAETAHREELKALNSPWWKRQSLDTVDVFALL